MGLYHSAKPTNLVEVGYLVLLNGIDPMSP